MQRVAEAAAESGDLRSSRAEAGAPTPGPSGMSYGSGTQGTEVRGPGPDSALNVGHARDHTASGHLVASGRFRALGIRLLRVAHAGIASYGLR